MSESLQSRVVKHACEVAGGLDALADRLGVSRILLRSWLGSTAVPPPGVFFRIVDIIQEHKPAYRVLVHGAADDPGGQGSRSD